MSQKDGGFSDEVSRAIGCYVYRLIDPRTAETFYVGKGKGNRVFAHASAEITTDDQDDVLSAKLARIRDIQNAGFEVQHIIHRHGLDDATAFEVEAAVMDAYPGIANVAGGHGNADRGARHSRQIIDRYMADDAQIDDPCIEIIVNRTSTEIDLYDATRFSWRLSLSRAEKAKYALAVEDGIVIQVYQDLRWMAATASNFPTILLRGAVEGRFGFEGKPVTDDSVLAKYLRKKVPPRARGAANPIRYHGI